MAFPHNLVTRTAWIASAVLAVMWLGRGLGHDSVEVVVSAGEAEDRHAFDRAAGVRDPVIADLGTRGSGDGWVGSEDVIISLTMVGDDESLVQGFTLTRPLDLRVVALGEGTGNEMHDYGVILEADTRRPVWTMDIGETHHAGGADKNRMIDAIVQLDAGNYLVHYITDGSHSYEDWNSDAPQSPELWGITLLGVHGRLDVEAVRPYDDRDNPAVLVRIVRVGDDESHHQEFSLDRAAEVRVYAIGEGDASEMYDYAWIEDARTGRVVWRMSYSDTEHAGGAGKNRLFDGSVRLRAGEYKLGFQSDDSHSFGDWNSSAPHDPFSYGVTVFRR